MIEIAVASRFLLPVDPKPSYTSRESGGGSSVGATSSSTGVVGSSSAEAGPSSSADGSASGSAGTDRGGSA